MKKLLYIFSCIVLVSACTQELPDFDHASDYAGKVAIDFGVQINDPYIATKAMADNPQLKNLMLAVFDETGYLVEYTWAIAEGTEYATENGTRYKYKVYLTQSKTPRIIHFIGNAPSEIKFGNEESVMSSISGSLGSSNEDIYWYRKEIPMISGTSSGGAMALAEEEESGPILQATPQTIAYMNDIPLIRNFAKIVLTSASDSGFALESYFVVGTPKTGLAAAYNYSSGEFVDYFNYVDSTDPELSKEGIKVLGDPKSYQYLTETEKYDANVPAVSQNVTLAEAQVSPVAAGASYYVYEKETPLSAEDAPYIIAYGTYSGKKYYYKVDLRDKDQYFPILRNFQYNVNITKVSREGYATIEEAAKSSGSGDISSSMTTISLAYISDGVASLEVGYTEKYITSEDAVELGFTFLPDVNNPNAPGDIKDIWIKVNEPGATGAAIATINGAAYTVGQEIKPSSNPGVIQIKPATPTESLKTQTLTIYARYTKDGIEHILQRTVTYKVQTKRTMIVELDPYEVPTVAGSEFDVLLTIPAGLSPSIFPLEFAIEAEALSVNPASGEQMPVKTGKSLSGNGKSSFHFVKTLTHEEYITDQANTIVCHFKTTKASSASRIFALNDYFEPQYVENDLENNRWTQDDDGHSVYLSNYTGQTFTNLRINNDATPDPIVMVTDADVSFTFNMSSEPSDKKVKVSLGGVKPANEEDPTLEYKGIENGYAIYEYSVSGTSGSLALITADEDSPIYIGLDAHHFVHNEIKADRQWSNFTGSWSKNSLGTTAGETVDYTLTIPQSGYYAGMVVTVKFEGLDFANGEPTDGKWTDKGNGVYEYRPSSAGNTPLNLMSTISGERTDKVTFSAAGFKQHEPTIEQRDALTATINSTISGEIDGFSNWSGNETQFTATISTNGAESYTANGNITRDGFLMWYTYEYSLTIRNWNVRYTDDTQSVTITLVHRGNTYKGTCTLRQLINGNVSLTLN